MVIAPPLPTVLVLAPAAVDSYIGPLGAMFCATLPSLRSFIVAMLARDKAVAAYLDDCTFLPSGMRVEVLQSRAQAGSIVLIVAVRVRVKQPIRRTG